MEFETLGESEAFDAGQAVDLGLLIETIQQYKFLYNMSHRHYKDARKKNLAWEEIGMIFNTTAETCQKYWKALRDKFVKERKKKSGSAASESDWVYFDRMLFYTKYSKPRKTYSATKPAEIDNFQTEDYGPPSVAGSVWSTMNVSSPCTPVEESLSETPTTSRPSTSKGRAVSKKRKADSDIAGVVEVAKQICSTLTNNSMNSANSNMKFAEYVYARLEEMPAEEAKDKRKAMMLLLEQ